MKVFGITGGSAADKLDLLEALLPALGARGLSVSTAKYINHPFDIDRPGKDSHAHRQAGATEVIVLSERRWALMHENRGPGRADDLDRLLRRMSPVDLVIALGFHDHPHAKLEIVRAGAERPLRCRRDPDIVALAGDAPIGDGALPDPPPARLGLDDIEAIADLIVARCGLDAG